MIKKVNTAPWTHVISDLNGAEIVETFYEKELQKTNQADWRAEKVIKRKGHRLYVNDNDDSLTVDKKDVVI